jgi:hypothetical protein
MQAMQPAILFTSNASSVYAQDIMEFATPEFVDVSGVHSKD